MVLEVALIDVRPGTEADFTAAYHSARSLLTAAGSHSVRMTQGVETPTRFVLMVEWDSVATHEAFRGGDGFVQWRAAIGPHFANPPHVEHFVDVD